MRILHVTLRQFAAEQMSSRTATAEHRWAKGVRLTGLEPNSSDTRSCARRLGLLRCRPCRKLTDRGQELLSLSWQKLLPAVRLSHQMQCTAGNATPP